MKQLQRLVPPLVIVWWAAAACHGQASGDVSTVVAAGRDVSAAESGLFEIIFAGGWIGFLIIMLLLALSMTAAYLVFEHLMTIRSGELMPPGLDSQVRDLLVEGHVSEAESACRNRPSFLS